MVFGFYFDAGFGLVCEAIAQLLDIVVAEQFEFA